MYGDLMRTLINLIEQAQQLDPRLVKYMRDNPDEVSRTKDEAIQKLQQTAQETGSQFSWALGKLPDGKLVQCFPKFIHAWNLPIVAQGTSRDL